MTDTTVRIGIVDNDPYALKVLRAVIGRLDPAFEVAWTAELGAVAVSRCLSPARRPDVLVTDMSMRDVSGTDVCRAIRVKTPAVGLVGITSYAVEAFRDEAARCGAQALVSKTDLAALTRAIRAAARGLPYDPQRPPAGSSKSFESSGAAGPSGAPASDAPAFLTAADAHALLEDASLASPSSRRALSPKERETLRRYADGENTREVAASLGVSVATVGTFERRALAKLGARSRAHAISICVRRHEF
ncbi:DNA-binding response regulator [Bifidobacterium sp. DSM 109958]|uniref:DNA-binding response regulator n=1 Tax=Bifidobacterium moraviense TaxID=2675323 RepID=A0A7Y0F162_9BIFI|nr:response regulator transcription factor [Bifidobacterium sp. DSM 109958]NMN00119.1 DNA-binding response regulator [Bifidobacterium sp. DSM 109958]